MSNPVTKEKANSLTDQQLEVAIENLSSLVNEKQFEFAELIAFGEQPHAASKLCGYKVQSAARLLNHPRVVDVIELLRVRNSRYSETTRDWRRLALKKSYDRLCEVSDQSLAANDLSISIKAETGKQNVIKVLNDMDQESQIRLTLEHGVNSLIASLDINLNADEEILAKLFHVMSLNGEELSTEKPSNEKVIEHGE